MKYQKFLFSIQINYFEEEICILEKCKENKNLLISKWLWNIKLTVSTLITIVISRKKAFKKLSVWNKLKSWIQKLIMPTKISNFKSVNLKLLKS